MIDDFFMLVIAYKNGTIYIIGRVKISAKIHKDLFVIIFFTL